MGVPSLAISMFAVMIVMLLSLLLLKMTANLFLAGNISLVALAWHFIFLPCLTGGIESSALSWNLVIPVLAVVFVSSRCAVFWTLFMLTEIFVLWWLKKIGYELPTIVLTPEQLLRTHLSNNIGPLLAVTLTLHFVEQGARDTLISQQKALLDRKKALLNMEKAEAESRQLLG